MNNYIHTALIEVGLHNKTTPRLILLSQQEGRKMIVDVGLVDPSCTTIDGALDSFLAPYKWHNIYVIDNETGKPIEDAHELALADLVEIQWLSLVNKYEPGSYYEGD